MNCIEQAKQALDALLHQAYDSAVAAGEFGGEGELRGSVEQPKDSANGDFAANHAMASAKALRMPPRKIAETLVSHLDLAESWFASAEVAGPGFLNFRLSPKWYADVLQSIESEGADYGRVDDGHGEKVMVEFVSANPTGPMTIGNARGGVLGDAMAAVLDRAGYDVWREFYVNDAGNQVDLFGRSIEARYLQLIQGEDAVEFPDNGYHGDDIKALAKLIYATISRPSQSSSTSATGRSISRSIPSSAARNSWPSVCRITSSACSAISSATASTLTSGSSRAACTGPATWPRP